MEFEQHYTRDIPAGEPAGNLKILEQIEPHATGIQAFFAKYAGATFNRGLFRILPLDQIRKWTDIATEMFPQYKGKMVVFSSDWRGQLYALNAKRLDGDQYQVQLLDPATSETLNIPATFNSFLNDELVNYPNDSLQVELFQEWLAAGKPAPAANECVAYIKPLRLGGVDDATNQEVTDMEVYWSFETQIQQQIANLPPGTKIDRINIQE
ncbi:T6SS immunity protein Tdi1 domain-containing protein [Anatilimnocola sp. NA78]|uniref:T6SS immunity protein Tdi1 domain-containing protein n=1 Tax=Anatilimnocola sp. NA78 TaxID=3415683 RepID=UPI003CE5AA90